MEQINFLKSAQTNQKALGAVDFIYHISYIWNTKVDKGAHLGFTLSDGLLGDRNWPDLSGAYFTDHRFAIPMPDMVQVSFANSRFMIRGTDLD